MNTRTQLIVMIGMLIIVITNLWFVAVKSSYWKNKPPSRKAVANVLAFVTDMAILAGFIVAGWSFWRPDVLATPSLVVSLVFIGSLFTLHVLFIFHRWIRPRIVA
jgi:hypothetical protein